MLDGKNKPENIDSRNAASAPQLLEAAEEIRRDYAGIDRMLRNFNATSRALDEEIGEQRMQRMKTLIHRILNALARRFDRVAGDQYEGRAMGRLLQAARETSQLESSGSAGEEEEDDAHGKRRLLKRANRERTEIGLISMKATIAMIMKTTRATVKKKAPRAWR